MAVSARFPDVPLSAGMYESFFLRAFSPEQPLGLWIRYTVHKRPGAAPRGSLWCTRFEAGAGRPLQRKLTSERLAVPAGGWIAVEDASIGPDRAEGSCGGVAWSLSFTSQEQELRHLVPSWLYRSPIPRTKLTSPAPHAVFNGVFEQPEGPAIEIRAWPGMVGHNWGSEHAERWVWLHGAGFADAPDAWLDAGLARVRVGSRLTPWLASGALSLDGRRHRLGGPLSSRPVVAESTGGARVELAGGQRTRVAASVECAADSTAGWRYADPDGGEHDVINCSVAALALHVTRRGAGVVTLRSAHGGAYELGMRERDHGIPIAPFPDG